MSTTMTPEPLDEDLSGKITQVDRSSVTVAGTMLLFEAPLPNEPENIEVFLRRSEAGGEHIAMSADVRDASGQLSRRRWETRASGPMRFLDELT